MTRVKICGITDPDHAVAATEAGAEYIGIVLAPSKRQVDVERAREISAAAKGSGALTVGVFVNTPSAEVNRIAKYCDLDRIQLSGDEPWEYVQELHRPAIKAIKISKEYTSEKLLNELSGGYKKANYYFLPLLDCAANGSYGGTGKSFNWTIATKAAERYRFVLAGGLTPKNVAWAIAAARPWGVDVSSGVETNGVKDIAKIKRFISTVRKIDAMP
ncbi:MAG: phosphoribosylanthranilate isomerase [Chloroflexota bacterium]|nr:phosphoribosylanthranilate isomerase [Chloroflexota bacterium]